MVLSDRQQRLQTMRDEMAPGAQPSAIVPRTFAEVMTMCQALAAADLAPKNLRGKATDMALVVMTGAEVGLPPMASLRLYTTWDGVPRLMAEGVRSIILSHPDCEYFEFKTCSDVEATWITKRRGRPEKSVTWTIERAKKAGLLGRDTWQKYPQDLLNARCSMQLGRLEWPHIIAGMRSLEEARDGDFIEAEFTESKPGFAAPIQSATFTKDPATGVLYSGPVKPSAPPADEIPAMEPAKRGPGRPPKNEAAKPPTGGEYRPTASADLPAPSGPTSSSPAPSPAATQPPQSASNANSAPPAGSSGGVEPRPTTTPPAASGSGASSPASGSPTIASSSTASSGPTASAETSSAANTAQSAAEAEYGPTTPSDDGFGADDPVDVVPADDVDAKMAEFRAWVAGCKTQSDLRAGLAGWQAWTRQRAEAPHSDVRFFKKGELTLIMLDLYSKRKAEVPA